MIAAVQTMTDHQLTLIGSTASALSALVAAVALFRLNHQLKLTRIALVATVDAQVYARIDAINVLLTTVPPIAAALEVEYKHGQGALENPAQNVADSFFTVIEQLHKQRYLYDPKNPLISDSQWKAWEQTIRHTMRVPFLRSYWKMSANLRYGAEFREYITGVLMDLN